MSEKVEKKVLEKLKGNIVSYLGKSRPRKIFVFVFGFLLPFIALSVEITTRICAGNLFDPLPTIYHALLIALVPITSILYLYFLNEKNLKLLSFLTGICLGVTGFYTVIFVPVIPIGIIAMMFFGIGLLPLSPLMALIASIMMMRFFLKTEIRPTKIIISGIITGLLCIVALELPVTLTRYAMDLATSDNKETKLTGIKLLRNFGSRDIMLRYCYVVRGKSPDLITFILERGSYLSPEKSREIYYQVTGNTFNNFAAPDDIKSRLQLNDEFIFDNDQAGEKVGAKLRSLNLANSKIDGIIDQKAGIAYSEWTMTFKNTANWTQESRFQIKTPPDSTVSRLTLWVNGEEREAAFAGKEQVKQAYQNIVAKRRDPVLVTSKGIDRFLVQCFPVPINGEMKIRLGISSPMIFNNKKESFLVLPQIIERNFNIDKNFKHLAWYDSKNYISTEDTSLKTLFSQDKFSMKGSIENEKMESFPYLVKIRRKEEIKDSWTNDTTNKNYIIKQAVKEIKNKKENKVTFVIDGSIETKKYIDDISEVIKNIPNSINTQIIVAGDRADNIEGRDNADKADNILRYNFVGGQDNSDALLKAVDGSDNKIVWLHGVQPESGYDYTYKYKNDELISTIRKLNKKPINELQFGIGDNVISENSGSYNILNSIPITGNFKQSLENFVNTLTIDSQEIVLERERVEKGGQDIKDQASLHLEKIWANVHVHNLLIKNNESKEAVKIASDYHIVTPVSGAVVLENAQQYKDSNLKPVEKSSVPIIPEPEEWLLIGIAGLFIIYSVYRKKNYAK